MAIDKREFWDSNFYNHPPLADGMIVIAETTLGVKLPKTLTELLMVQNGGYTKGFVFPMAQKTTWAENHVPLSELFGIVLDENAESAQNIMDTAYMTKEWGLPEKQVLLTGDGHWWITFDYRNGEIPCVKWIDVECSQEIKIADTFDQFIDGLVPSNLY